MDLDGQGCGMAAFSGYFPPASPAFPQGYTPSAKFKHGQFISPLNESSSAADALARSALESWIEMAHGIFVEAKRFHAEGKAQKWRVALETQLLLEEVVLEFDIAGCSGRGGSSGGGPG